MSGKQSKKIAATAQDFGRVAVLCGGNSSERQVSLNSGNSVLVALQSKGVNAQLFDPAHQSIVDIRQFDRVFNVLHGRGGEDGQIQGLLQWLNIPYTGSGIFASALGMDKVRTKQLWHGCGLPTPAFALLDADTDWQQLVDTLGLPLMIKPVHEGSSIGMSKVTAVSQLPQAYALAAKHDAMVMAESWITGREYTIVVIADEAYPVIRLKPADNIVFYDYEAKYERNDTNYFIPCGLTQEEEKQLQALCLTAFHAVEATGWGRIDAMQDEQGNFWLLEINTVPGMTDHSLVPMAAKAKGMDFVTLCWQLLQQTL